MSEPANTAGAGPPDVTAPPRNPSRKLLGGVGVAAAVAVVAVVAAVEEKKQPVSTPIPKGSIRVNGADHAVTSPSDTPLLYVLRDELGLKGPKFGCGLGQCGACAVLVNGKETRSCVTGWTDLRGEVTTLEGLPAKWAAQKSLAPAVAATTLHPVQQAWIDQQVPQCGYCQNGMMIMAVDLLSHNASPTDAQIKTAFTDTPPSPHLCRCGTYQSIIAAIKLASKRMA